MPLPSAILPSLSLKFHVHLEQARTAALNSLHLSIAVHCPPEPLGQLVAVPELALLRLHVAQLASGTATHEAVGLRRGAAAGTAAAAHHRAMLAGFLAVLGEGLGEGLGGRGGVDLRSVVDFCFGRLDSGLGFSYTGEFLRERRTLRD